MRSLLGGWGGEQGGAPFPGHGREWPGMVDRHVPGNGGSTFLVVFVFVIWDIPWAAGSRAAGQPGAGSQAEVSRREKIGKCALSLSVFSSAVNHII